MIKPNIEEAKSLLYELNGNDKKVPIHFANKKIYIKSTSRNRMLVNEFMSNDWTWKMLINHLDKQEIYS